MTFSKNKLTANAKIIGVLIVSTLILASCVPVVLGGGAFVGTLATREKGVIGTASDSQISTVLKAKIYSFSSDLYTKIVINVQNGEVLFIGSVPNTEWPAEAEKIAWGVSGVKHVINHIEVTEEESITNLAKDVFITTQIKTKLLANTKIRSLNFNITTVKGVVYIMGNALTQEELDAVSECASKVSGVVKVLNYAKLKGESTP